ncbi:MAG: S8 family peptidase [Polyangiaceae bacterium]
MPNEDFPLRSLGDERGKIEIVAVTDLSPTLSQATLFVPDGQLKVLERKLSEFVPTDPAKAPRSVALVSSLESIRRSVARSFWTDPSKPFPSAAGEHWLEVWLRRGVDVARFRRHAQILGVHASARELRFPDRTVLLVRASVPNMIRSAELLDAIAELRAASPLDLEFVGVDASLEGAVGADLAARALRAAPDAPAVCVLDTGVDFDHPLLKAALVREDAQTCFGEDIRDRFGGGDWHGTGTAGLALYGLDLPTALLATENWQHSHHLESVKYIPSAGQNEPDLYGEVTKEAVARAELQNPSRRRVIVNTVTAEAISAGEPTSWSAAVDQLCSGYDDEDRVRRLVVLAAGNVVPHDGYAYPDTNHLSTVEDPGQAWNAITVGAYTDRTEITDAGYDGYASVAAGGNLSPTSRTSIAWSGANRMAPPPIKPDLVNEGGNWARETPSAMPVALDALTPLTTRRREASLSRLLGRFGATSGASALTANLAARLQAEYTQLWRETIRALLVHSCRYTPAMEQSFSELSRRRRAEALLRCFGHGVPDLERARYSARNELTLVIEREIQPFRIDAEEKKGKTNEMHLHRLPWPSELLEDLGALQTRLRVTLSYFVEPNPGKRGVSGSAQTLIVDPARYPSFGLRFDVTAAGESPEALLARVNASERREDDDLSGDLNEWDRGRRRTRGSIHSDVWSGSAVSLADKSAVAVYPVNGWWRFHHKEPEICERKARYALIVSIETDAEEVDVYTPVFNQIVIER